jgi:lipoate---protein ligase
MSTPLKIFISESHDPWFNLATEDWIFHDLAPDQQVLFLWRNDNTVVIGRSQNPWLECHLEKMQQDQVKLARRQSGGGAVFHDLGNTNFTFLSPKQSYDKQRNFTIITQSLAQLGIVAKVQGRNDIVAQDAQQQWRKISGNAFKEKVDRAFHHGTLLLNANMTRLAQYLNPSKKKMQAKGIKSVRSRVINATDINPDIQHQALCAVLMEQFQQAYSARAEMTYLSPENLARHDSLQQHYQQLQSKEWLYGQTLPFTHELNERFAWGEITIRLNVQGEMIRHSQVFSDCLYPDFIAELQLLLANLRYDGAVLAEQLNRFSVDQASWHDMITDTREMLQKQLPELTTRL